MFVKTFFYNPKLMNNFIFKKTLVIGLGVMGGSLAKALKKYDLSHEIFAFDEDYLAIESAKKQKIIDGFALLDEAINEFDLIVIATPLSSYQQIFKKIFPFLNQKNLVIDLGSIKDFSRLSLKLPTNFIACHPIAGSHQSGFEFSSAELFANKKFVICNAKNLTADVKKIQEMVNKIAGEIDFLEAKKHDEIFALTSHLPQFLSFLSKEFSPKNLDDIFLQQCFRLDQSSGDIWSDIFKFNEKNIEKYYEEFFINLSESFENLTSFNYDYCKQLAVNYEIPLPNLIEQNIFNDNFSSIFFRFLIVANYLKINDLKNNFQYCGSGFRDFTSLIAFCNLDAEKIKFFVKKDLIKIQKFYQAIS